MPDMLNKQQLSQLAMRAMQPAMGIEAALREAQVRLAIPCGESGGPSHAERTARAQSAGSKAGSVTPQSGLHLGAWPTSP